MLLTTTPLDLKSSDLGVRFGAPMPPSVLAEITVEPTRTLPGSRFGNGRRLHLAIIGGSHVATIYGADNSVQLREELSCHAAESGRRLERGVDKEKEVGLHSYRFTVAPMELAESEFRQLVQFLQKKGGADPRRVGEEAATHVRDGYAPHLAEEKWDRWLVGEFPGEEPGHITALATTWHDPGQAQWKTWHLYPHERVAVISRSTFTRRDCAERKSAAPLSYREAATFPKNTRS